MKKRKALFLKGKFLEDLDDFYNHTVVNLPVNVRLEYIESLIMRCKYDLKSESDKSKIEALKKIIKAAKRERVYLKTDQEESYKDDFDIEQD